MVRVLVTDADQFTWAAAVVGSNNAAGYQLAADVPVMAVGGFNGTDPSPTLEEFIDYVAEGRIHYFIEGQLMMGRPDGTRGSAAGESEAIADWVALRYPAITLDGTVIYDLTQLSGIS